MTHIFRYHKNSDIPHYSYLARVDIDWSNDKVKSDYTKVIDRPRANVIAQNTVTTQITDLYFT